MDLSLLLRVAQAAVADARKAAADEQLAAKIATDRLEAVAAQCAEHETKAAAQAQRIKELTSQVCARRENGNLGMGMGK